MSRGAVVPSQARKANEFMAQRNAAGNELQKALALETRRLELDVLEVLTLTHYQYVVLV